MSITVVWSSTSGGSAIAAPLSHGTGLRQGTSSAYQTIHLRHNGANPITSCGIYLQPYTGTYTGDFTAAADKAELLEWGDGITAQTFGGIQLNMNASGSFPDASWPILSDKTTSDGKGFTIRSGVGDSSTNPITIHSATGATSSGTLQAGSSPNISFQMRLVIPQSEDTSGSRIFELILTYTSTT